MASQQDNTRANDPLVGLVLLDRFHITSVLGEGEAAVVYAARQDTAPRKVAVKVLRRELADSADHQERFRREIAAASSIVHPNSLRVFADGHTLEGLPFYVMEYFPARTLAAEILRKKRFSSEKAVEIARQIAWGLSAAHDKGVVHRDINPSNVMLDRRAGRYRVKIFDWGLARNPEANQEEVTQTGLRVGDFSAMCPEYVRDNHWDAKSDLYGLGVILFQMLTGHAPFVGSRMAVLHSHLTTPAPAPSQEIAGVPEWIDELVLSLLAKDPDDRPEDAESVARLIEEQQIELADPATQSIAMMPPKEMLERDDAPRSLSTAAPVQRVAGPKRRTAPPPWLWTVVGTFTGLSLVVLIALLVFLLLR